MRKTVKRPRKRGEKIILKEIENKLPKRIVIIMS